MASFSSPRARRAPTSSAAPEWAQSIRGFTARPRGGQRQAALAPTAHPPRSVELRPCRSTGPAGCRGPGQFRCRGHAGNQHRHALPVRSDQGPPLFPIKENPVPPQPRGGRAGLANATIFLPARARIAEAARAGDAWGVTFWDRAKCRDLIAAPSQRRPLHAPRHPRHDRPAGLHRRGGLGWHRGR